MFHDAVDSDAAVRRLANEILRRRWAFAQSPQMTALFVRSPGINTQYTP